MKRMLRENGLSIVWLGLFFFAFIVGQIATGRLEYNNDQREHSQPEVGFAEYLTTPHFIEATMENWESEFLQMFLFVALQHSCTRRVQPSRRSLTRTSQSTAIRATLTTKRMRLGPCDRED